MTKKINKKKIRTSKFALKLFGIEGGIALKNIKRNKKKYRVTIVSLFISIVLFISFSSYMNYTLNTASSVMGEVPYDYQISYFGDDPNNDKEALDKINEIVKSSDVKEYVSYIVKLPELYYLIIGFIMINFAIIKKEGKK